MRLTISYLFSCILMIIAGTTSAQKVHKISMAEESIQSIRNYTITDVIDSREDKSQIGTVLLGPFHSKTPADFEAPLDIDGYSLHYRAYGFSSEEDMLAASLVGGLIGASVYQLASEAKIKKQVYEYHLQPYTGRYKRIVILKD